MPVAYQLLVNWPFTKVSFINVELPTEIHDFLRPFFRFGVSCADQSDARADKKKYLPALTTYVRFHKLPGMLKTSRARAYC